MQELRKSERWQIVNREKCTEAGGQGGRKVPRNPASTCMVVYSALQIFGD